MYFQNLDQVSGKRDEISSKNITQVGVEEELLLSDWDKNEPPEKKIFDSETSSSNQQNMENKSGNLSPCVHVGISKYEGT